MRTLGISICVVACLVTLALARTQRRTLVSLREQEQQLRTQASEALPVASQSAADKTVVATMEQYTPSPELLHLRGEIGQLERRKRELAGARLENERLRVQFASKGTNAPGAIALPAGYIKKSDAKYAGYSTPEDTIQTMLWAIRDRNTTHFLQAFNPEMAKQLEAEMQRRGSPEEFFKEADAMPGLRVTGKEVGVDDTMVLIIEMLPGDEATSQKMRFKQFGGEWKLMSGL